MTTIKQFEDIEAWQTARKLCNTIYEMTKIGEFARDYGLKDQIRRAAVSVMSNIAEGFESRTQALFVDFLGRAKGSAGEVRAQLYIALDCKYIPQASFAEAFELADKVIRQIYRFMAYLTSQPNLRKVR
jgi:four helix bundle protein